MLLVGRLLRRGCGGVLRRGERRESESHGKQQKQFAEEFHPRPLRCKALVKR